jgi:hypothetical protein
MNLEAAKVQLENKNLIPGIVRRKRLLKTKILKRNL